MISELLEGRSRPVRTVVSLAALGAVVYAAVITDPGLGLHGRERLALICTVLGGLGWLARTAVGLADPEPRHVTAPTVVLVLAGCLLIGAEPASVGLVFAGIGVFTAALVFSPSAALALTGAGVVALAVGEASYGHDWVSFGGYAAGMAAIGLFGFNRRQRRERLAAAEQAQEDRAKAAALGERARIAREIHDVLAHSLGALSVQLEAADALLVEDSDPDRAQQHVERARRLAADGLAETRHAIGALRGSFEQAPPLAEQLRALAAEYRADTAAAAEVEVREQPQLAPDAALAAYRTAQEALTNVRKHAPGSPVTILLAREENGSVLTVTDAGVDGSAPGSLADAGGGYGLTGLTERAEALGGSLSAGPEQSGWTVRLWLPA
jgi:signal transduction histidine kinase